MRPANVIIVAKKGVPQRIYLDGKLLDVPIEQADIRMRPGEYMTLEMQVSVGNVMTLELDPHA